MLLVLFAVVAGLAALAMFWIAVDLFREARAMARTETSRIADAESGTLELSGTVSTQRTVESPVTGREVAYAEYQLTIHRKDKEAEETQDGQVGVLAMQDDSAAARFEPGSFRRSAISAKVSKKWPRDEVPDAVAEQIENFDEVEEVLALEWAFLPGSPIYAIGTATVRRERRGAYRDGLAAVTFSGEQSLMVSTQPEEEERSATYGGAGCTLVIALGLLGFAVGALLSD